MEEMVCVCEEGGRGRERKRLKGGGGGQRERGGEGERGSEGVLVWLTNHSWQQSQLSYRQCLKIKGQEDNTGGSKANTICTSPPAAQQESTAQHNYHVTGHSQQ